jgi:DNA repair exonuclease SbcCD nuclease subunit
MKILFIGDPHIKTDNHIDVDILLSELEKICQSITFDLIIVGGDIMHYHERIFTQALNKTLHFIKTLSKYAHIDILVGNHDMINNQQFLTSNHWLNVFSEKNISVIDKPIKKQIDKFIFMLCPYVFPGRFIEALETVDKNWQECNVIFAHQEFKGCKMGSIISVEGDEWKKEYPQIISGHIHDNQIINNIYYPGTPLQHSFGDSEKRIVCYIDENNKIINLDLNVPKKKIVKATLSTLPEIKETSMKIKLSATQEEFKLFKQSDQYKEYIDKGVKIQLEKTKSEIHSDQKTFQTILDDLILKDGNSLLKKIYKSIINE